MDAIKQKGLTPLSPDHFKKNAIEGGIILDIRPAALFSIGFIPGSIFIGLEGRFADWAVAIIPNDKPILLVTEMGKEAEAISRLTRAGFTEMIGYLEGSFDAWKNAGEQFDLIVEVEADELAMDIPHDPNLLVLDVRGETAFADGHIKDALNLPLNEMTNLVNLAQFEDNQNLYIHSSSGYRSIIACSLIKKQGMHNIRNIAGGWEKIKEEKNIKIIKEASLLN
jgi:rhodanese-related sulfurtransferase